LQITLTSEESVRLEPTSGPMTIEAPTADRLYSPFHMLGSSLAFCTYSILASWASNAGIGTDSLVVDVAWSFGEKPHRVTDLRVAFSWPELPASRRAAAQRVAELCTVHATLTHPPAITIALVDAAGETGAAAEAVTATPATPATRAASAPEGAAR